MKALLLLSLLIVSISSQKIGACTGTPKMRPIECFYGQVLNEDIPELKELLEKYRNGDDHEFADYSEKEELKMRIKILRSLENVEYILNINHSNAMKEMSLEEIEIN